MQSTGRTIRLLRHQNGWTQEEVATRLGISIPAYSKIETGITDMNLSRVTQIADLFGLSVVELLAGTAAPDETQQRSLESAHERLRGGEQEVIDLQRKVIELFEQCRERAVPVTA